ncbi:MFS transporter [Gryllotalpicola daejeonensis]|uniref:MFS transporter n=1 Tax=Gryllotalpicola daejeonensis TaxID=993087 RepID=A0ABP7ZGJ1_9MICO
MQRTVLLVAILASFVAFLDGSVVNVALPAIARELGGGLALQQWVVDAYLVTLGALILVAGSLSDLFSRTRVLFGGLIGFGAASVLCAVAPTAGVLIAARAVQGVAGALLVPSSLALIISAFEGPAQSKAIGRWTAWTGIAMLIGPFLGGLFVDTLSWRWVFAINVVPIAATLLLLARLPKAEGRPNARVDVPGAVLGAVALGGIVFALIEQGQRGWVDAVVIASAAIGVLAAIGFVLVERRVRQPMLPMSIFRAHDFAVGNVATFAIYAAFSLGPLMVGLYLQQVARVPAALAGLALVPSTLAALLLASRFGVLAGKYGARWFMTAGPLVVAAGFLSMLLIRHPFDYWTQLLPGTVIVGLGISITVAPLTSAILGSIPETQAGIASAINNAVARVAGLVAVACAGFIVGEHLDLAGLQRTIIVLAVLLAAGAAVSGIGIRDEFLAERPTPAPRP